MPRNEHIALSGVIQDVFAHRFTVHSDGTMHLADLGPRGLDAFPIEAGLSVELEGEQRPSEIKVTRIGAQGRKSVHIEHKKPHHKPHHKADHRHPEGPADPGLVLSAVAAAGWTAIGEPQRKPKHFEVLARRGDRDPVELHVDFDGVIYKDRPADRSKWALPA